MFEFTRDSVFGLELVGLVTVCLELVTPPGNLERSVNVSLNTEDSTAQGIKHFLGTYC